MGTSCPIPAHASHGVRNGTVKERHICTVCPLSHACPSITPLGDLTRTHSPFGPSKIGPEGGVALCPPSVTSQLAAVNMPLPPWGSLDSGEDGAGMGWVADWSAQAACRTTDPDELFVQGAAQNRAKAVCTGCPVRTECLADALDNRVEFGVWGGMTERERRALLRRRPTVTSWRRLSGDRAHGVRAGSGPAARGDRGRRDVRGVRRGGLDPGPAPFGPGAELLAARVGLLVPRIVLVVPSVVLVGPSFGLLVPSVGVIGPGVRLLRARRSARPRAGHRWPAARRGRAHRRAGPPLRSPPLRGEAR